MPFEAIQHEVEHSHHRQRATRMTQTGAKKDRGVEQKPAPRSQSESRCHHHVELVLGRIFAKQHTFTKESLFRHVELENVDTDR